MTKKLQFRIEKDWTDPFKNYERSCYLLLKMGRKWLEVDHYGRMRDAKKGAKRIAKTFGIPVVDFDIVIQ